MHDSLLKFADHGDALAAFEAGGLQLAQFAYHDTGLPEGLLVIKAVGPACEGVVHAPTGESKTDAGGNEYPVMTAAPGFHANVLRLADGVALPEALSGFQVAPQPETPVETFS